MVQLLSFGHKCKAQKARDDAVRAADRPAQEGGKQLPQGAPQHHRQAAWTRDLYSYTVKT
jgi:hypothetical protein